MNSPYDNQIIGSRYKKNHNPSIDVHSKTAEKVINNISECHFTNDKSPVCSPRYVVNTMKDFIQNKGIPVSSNHSQKIVQTMKDLLNCKSESCILKRPDFQEFAKHHNLNNVLDRFFKPEGPSTDFGLLSNFNIDDVLDQFEEKFKHRHFLHIPFQMRDFEKIGTQLATIDLADKFRNGYKTFGVVLNTDVSNGKGGIHWFCLFGEKFDDYIQIEYFNSSGHNPLPEVQAWLHKTKHYLHKELNLPIHLYYSVGIQYQNDDHSCGVYCLCYIWLRLEQVPPHWFKPENFNDHFMHKARFNLFRHEI